MKFVEVKSKDLRKDILNYLKKHPGASTKEIADFLKLRSCYIFRQMRKLDLWGFVETDYKRFKRSDGTMSKAKGFTYRATEKGKRFLEGKK